MSHTESPLVECARSYALVTLACVVAIVGARLAHAEGYAQLGVAAALFFAATRGSERMEGGATRAGIALGGLFEASSDSEGGGFFGLADLARTLVRGVVPALREFGVALLVALAIFPPFFFGYVRWFGLEGVVEWRPPMELLGLSITQLVLVAIPEEVYFRGYLQTRLGDAWPPRRIAGIDVSVPAVVTQAVLFGLLHFIVDPNPGRLAVAAPALLFGLMRAGRGGVGAAIFFHALCNLYSETLALSVR